MPVESIAADMQKRKEVTHLEALGRLITGISTWLELGPDNTIEGKLRAEYIDLALKSISNGVNPQSPDYLNFNNGCCISCSRLAKSTHAIMGQT